MKVAVLFGGTTAERDVSIGSGTQVANALREAGHEVVAVDTARGVLDAGEERRLREAGVGAEPPERGTLDMIEKGDVTGLTRAPEFQGTDVVFLTLHGGAGEDGRLQALLDLAGVPYTGSGHIGSALAMDKEVSKQLFRAAHVPTPDWLMAPVAVDTVDARLGWPVVVKPSKQGSTVGLTVVHAAEDFAPAVDEAFRHDDEVIIESFIAGRELTVPILGEEALPVGEVIAQHEIFDYECKYQPGMAEEVFPADLESGIERGARRLALAAHRVLKLSGYSRIDFRLDANGGLWCLEANTAPGLSAASLVPKGARAAGIEFPDFCERVCRLALEEHGRRERG